MMPEVRRHPIALSTFEHAWDTHPKAVQRSVEALVVALTRFPVIKVADKRSLPAWSPAVFEPGARRRAEAVRAVSCLVMDVDHGDFDAAFEPWPGVLAVVHTTWSHRADAQRFRLVIPLVRPVPAPRWRSAWRWAAGRCPGSDPACKDPSRLYFRPAVPSPEAERSARVQGGRLLDVLDELPDEPPPVPAPAVASRPVVRVPARLRDRAIGVRLSHDPAIREQIALEIGAQVVGTAAERRAVRGRCPSCGRASVWFYLAPQRWRGARCDHRESCGWEGRLDALLYERAA